MNEVLVNLDSVALSTEDSDDDDVDSESDVDGCWCRQLDSNQLTCVSEMALRSLHDMEILWVAVSVLSSVRSLVMNLIVILKANLGIYL